MLCKLLANGCNQASPFLTHPMAEAEAEPEAGGMNTLRLLSYDCFLAMLVAIAGRCGTPPTAASAAARRWYLDRKQQKTVMVEFARRFALKPAKAVEWLLAVWRCACGGSALGCRAGPQTWGGGRCPGVHLSDGAVRSARRC